MYQKLRILSIFILLAGCAKPNYFQQDALYQPNKPDPLKETKPGYAWVTAGKHYQKNILHRLIWGQHYRHVWATPVQIPILNLPNLPGNLTPTDMGGGLQTTSLSLTDQQKRTFTLRTLEKDPAKSISPKLRKTFIANIMRDQTSAINPYAAFTVPPLAEAVQLFHTNPKVYYVPQTGAGLDTYSSVFGGKVVMLEEKFTDENWLNPVFGEATNIIDTEELQQREQQSNKHQVNQSDFAKARLFDIILCDWDRHEGQWNWAEYTSSNNTKTYKPIPKDRDYAYYCYHDGLLTWLLTRRLIAGKIKPFIHNIPDVGGLIYKARDLDNQYLNELTAEEWQQVALTMQASLTEEVLKKAMLNFPDPVYQLEGERTLHKLQKKVKQLPQSAQEFYEILAKEVTVKGSAEKERFVVKHYSNKTTLVEVFALTPANQESQLLYHRLFSPADTKKIFLLGLGDNDQFRIEGSNQGLQLILDGGAGTNELVQTPNKRIRKRALQILNIQNIKQQP